MRADLPPVDDTMVWDVWLSYYHLPAISAALELGIFEALAEAPCSPAALADALGFQRRVLEALLPLLASLGLLRRHAGDYVLSEAGRHYMLAGSPLSWGSLFKRVSKALIPHKLLVDALRGERGNVARPADGWESGHVDREMAREVTAFMHSHSAAAALGLSRNPGFAKVSRLLDVGGGSGCFAVALARANPALRGTVMELPTIADLARDYIAEAGLADRVDTVSVDMFRQDWPQGYDAHFFSNIFHDWSPDTCLQIARRSLAALAPGGRICLHEMLLDDGGMTPRAALSFSLLMSMGTMGQQFTFPQLRDLLREAGFVDVSCEPAYGYYSLVTGCKG